MTHEELDVLLGGATGGTVTFDTPDGPVRIYLTRHELKHPHAWRAAMRRALGHTGYQPPVYSQEDHDQMVRALFTLADAAVTV